MITVAVSTTNSLLDLIGDHAEPWGYVAVFVVAALESSAFTGLAVPGETLLLFAGFLAWRGDLNVFLTIAMAFVGAVVGDSIGYEIGRNAFGMAVPPVGIVTAHEARHGVMRDLDCGRVQGVALGMVVMVVRVDDKLNWQCGAHTDFRKQLLTFRLV